MTCKAGPKVLSESFVFGFVFLILAEGGGVGLPGLVSWAGGAGLSWAGSAGWLGWAGAGLGWINKKTANFGNLVFLGKLANPPVDNFYLSWA